jgi:hypothetical protein
MLMLLLVDMKEQVKEAYIKLKKAVQQMGLTI